MPKLFWKQLAIGALLLLLFICLVIVGVTKLKNIMGNYTVSPNMVTVCEKNGGTDKESSVCKTEYNLNLQKKD